MRRRTQRATRLNGTVGEKLCRAQVALNVRYLDRQETDLWRSRVGSGQSERAVAMPSAAPAAEGVEGDQRVGVLHARQGLDLLGEEQADVLVALQVELADQVSTGPRWNRVPTSRPMVSAASRATLLA